MNRVIRLLVVASSAMVIAPRANADLAGLVVFREPGGPGQPPLGAERWVYRVYAEFTNSTDSARGWGVGDPTYGLGSIWNITEDGSPGSGFTNIPDFNVSNTAPPVPGTFQDWDTYATIGILHEFEGPDGVDHTHFSGPMFIVNGATSWTGIGGTSLSGPNLSQGRADYRVTGNDTENRVLLMQLVVNAGEHVTGSIGVAWRSLPGELTFSSDVPFSSVPAPAILTVLAMPALRSRRKRY